MSTVTRPDELGWRQLAWPAPLTERDAVSGITALATDPTGVRLILEVRGSANGLRYLLGTEPGQLRRVVELLGCTAARLATPRRPVTTVRRLALSSRLRALTTNQLETSTPALLAALTAADRPGEELLVQVLVGERLPGQVVSANATAPPRLRDLFGGGPSSGKLDSEARAALTQKVAGPGFRAEVRIGVEAATPARRQTLALGLLGALRRLEAPGLRVGLSPLSAPRLGQGSDVPRPWRLRTRLSVAEVIALAGLPVTDPKRGSDLPGLPPAHPRPLSPAQKPVRPGKHRAIVAEATAPGMDGHLTRTTDALLRHTHIAGPTGTGKSVLLLNLALQDMAAGRGLIVMEPKGDLIADLLARIPAHRLEDVVVLDPLADQVVGINPLPRRDAAPGTDEVRADAVLGVFTGLFGDALGPRTTDVLHACLLTLARRSDASLVHIPRLLSDPSFRLPRIAAVADDVALGPFWAWYQGLRDSERAAVIAPLMNKLRAVLLKPAIRRVLGQVEPRFHISQVFTERKILLVPLPVASLGSEGARLLGSLIAAQIWDAARARTQAAVHKRQPVSVVLDECQTFLDFQTDIADALATSRSYGVGWTLAHQYLGQLPPTLREAVLTNCRSRVVFQTSSGDAKVFADQTSGRTQLQAEDFTSLPAFHAYISLYDAGQTQPYASGRTLPAPAVCTDPDQIRTASAKRYGRAVAEIEAGFVPGGVAPGATDGPAVATAPLGRLPRRAGATAAAVASDRPSGRSQAAEPGTRSHAANPAKLGNESSAGSADEPSPGGGAGS
ncbi:MAG TPA: TraM recognition domain-containing protein [Candidatus Nanoperiomorbaceae bacterium]|nr:TraM recognition domain-containing protein [Candidatus Nanoperiomorbaceae bacterium]